MVFLFTCPALKSTLYALALLPRLRFTLALANSEGGTGASTGTGLAQDLGKALLGCLLCGWDRVAERREAYHLFPIISRMFMGHGDSYTEREWERRVKFFGQSLA